MITIEFLGTIIVTCSSNQKTRVVLASKWEKMFIELRRINMLISIAAKCGDKTFLFGV
jgi:hypothetical protein